MKGSFLCHNLYAHQSYSILVRKLWWKFWSWACVWGISVGIRVLLGKSSAGSGAGAVPEDRRQEVAVLEGHGGRSEVLRPPHAPWPEPFKKACGTTWRISFCYRLCFFFTLCFIQSPSPRSKVNFESRIVHIVKLVGFLLCLNCV